jgi:hypothetical protein
MLAKMLFLLLIMGKVEEMIIGIIQYEIIEKQYAIV